MVSINWVHNNHSSAIVKPTPVQPGLVPVRNRRSVVERRLCEPSLRGFLQRRVVGRIALGRLVLEQRLSLLRPVGTLGVRKGLLASRHDVGPVLGIRGQVVVPGERLDSLRRASLVDEAEGEGSVISLGEAEGDEGDDPLDDADEVHGVFWRAKCLRQGQFE